MVVRVAGLSFDQQCKAAGLPVPMPELRFAPPRRWRFDWAWPDLGLALEVQGGVFIRGRHTRGAALLKEYEKLNAAAVEGYRMLFCTPREIGNGEAVAIVAAALGLERAA